MKSNQFNIYFISVTVFVMAAVNYLIVTNFYSAYEALIMPEMMPPKALFDVLWLLTYIFFAFGWEMTYIHALVGRGQQRIAHYQFLIILLINTLMNISFFPFEKYYLAGLLNIMLLASLLYIGYKSLAISKKSLIGLIPYLGMATLSCITLFYFVIVNGIPAF